MSAGYGEHPEWTEEGQKRRQRNIAAMQRREDKAKGIALCQEYDIPTSYAAKLVQIWWAGKED